MLRTVRRDLIPAVEGMIKTFTRIAGPDIVKAIAAIAKLFEALSPHIAFVAKIVATLATALADLFRTNPQLAVMAGGFLALGAAVKAIKFLAVITGLKTVIGWAAKAAAALKGVGLAGAGAGAAGGIAGRNAALAGAGGAAAGGGAMAFLKKWGGRLIKFVGGRVILPVGIALTVYEAAKAVLPDWLVGLKPKEIKFRAMLVGMAWKELKKEWRKRVDFIARKVGAVWHDVKKAVSKVVRFIGRTVGGIWRTAKAAVRKVVSFVGRVVGAIWRTAKAAVRKVVEFISKAVGDLWRTAKDVWKKAIEFVSQAVGDLWKKAKDTWKKRVEFVAEKVGDLWETAKNTITKVVRFVARKIGFAEGGIVPGYAEGGEAPTERPREHRGGKFSRPTYLVGEENRPEYVIATNPAYRKQNIGYLRMAAQALGVVPGFQRGGRITVPEDTGGFEARGFRVISGRGTKDVLWRGPGGGLYRQGPGESLVPAGGDGGGGGKFLSFTVTAGFARGGVPGFARGGWAEDGSWIPNAARYWGASRRRGARAEDGSWISNPSRYWGGSTGASSAARNWRDEIRYWGERPPRPGMVQNEEGRWITRGAFNRGRDRSFDDELEGEWEMDDKGNVKRVRKEIEPPDYKELARIHGILRSARGAPWRTYLGGALRQNYGDLIGAHLRKDEHAIELLTERTAGMQELIDQVVQIRRELALERTIGRRLHAGQMGEIGAFRTQVGLGVLPYVGSFATGGRVRIPQMASVPRQAMRSGIAQVHHGEMITPAPKGGSGSQVAPTSRSPEINVEVVLKDRAGELVELIDARADGRVRVHTRQQAQRTRALRSAPGYSLR